jgi:hypothetical protein
VHIRTVKPLLDARPETTRCFGLVFLISIIDTDMRIHRRDTLRLFSCAIGGLSPLVAASLGTMACSGEDHTDLASSPAAETATAPQDGPATEPAETERFLLASITIDADGNRISYAQVIDHLSGHFDNDSAIEAPGNAVFLTRGSDFFYGLAESPTWVRYATDGGFRETGRLSFANFGVTYMDFANVIVDDDTAVSVLTGPAVAVVWNPTTMSVRGMIELPHLVREGFELEAFTTVARDGLVYVPGKWVNWETADVVQSVSITILDPKTLSIVGVAEDDRCGAGGRVTFDRRGYAYVMGDGRNQSMQVFAAARGEPVVPNCLLRIPPGGSDFEPDYYYEIPSLTGGLDSMTELESASSTLDDGIGFTMMMYPERIPDGLDRVNFEHWGQPAFKMWRIVLGDVPVAEAVAGANFSVVGFPATGVAGKLYNPESADGSESSVFAIDPQTNTAALQFTMDGYFAALLPLGS